MDKILSSFENNTIDLIVLSGDQITANNIDSNATAYYDELAERVLIPHGIPWATIFGNHDDAPFEIKLPDGKTELIPTKTSRKELASVDAKHDLSLTKIGQDKLFGVSNYWLNIYLNDNVAARVLLLDSGGGTLLENITQDQIDWIKETNKLFSDTPTIVFEHIPSTKEEFSYHGNDCSRGLVRDTAVAPLSNTSAKIVDALADNQNMHLLAVGHNHGYDYCCPYYSDTKKENNLHLCFGRHSGYGGYGTWDRGARVYKLEYESSPDEKKDVKNWLFQWSSYIRMESGKTIHEYVPLQPTPTEALSDLTRN